MTDDPLTGAARPPYPYEIVDARLRSVMEFPVFRQALEIFGETYGDVNARRGGGGLRGDAVAALDEAAWTLVEAAANFHCARVLHAVFADLDAAGGGEEA